MKIRIGTRGSKLALWQAERVKELLEGKGYTTEFVLFKTTGDADQTTALDQIGDRGLFTKVLDDAVLQGEIDLAVHSSKDIPGELPEGLILGAVMKREDPRDVLLSENPRVDLENQNENFVIGTSSVKRAAFLAHYAPAWKVKLIRGNVDTRVGKMRSGEYDALILAYAGVKRMGFQDLVVQKLNSTVFTPAAGQGAVGVVWKEGSEKHVALKEALNHETSEISVRAERAFQRRIGGGCHKPVFVLATLTGDALGITGGVASIDGSKIIRENIQAGIGEPEKAGTELADMVLKQGGQEILNEQA